MALSAVGAELAAMNVGVAVRAILTDVRKDRPEVALGAVDFFMHAAERKSRAFMVEFRYGANRGPARIRVTILARNGQGSMRTPARLPLGGHRAARGEQKDTERE